MHIAFVDANPASLEAIRCAREEGHRVSYIQSAEPYYRLTPHNLGLVRSASWLKDGVATTDAAAVTAALAECHAAEAIDFAATQHEMCVAAVALACKALGLPGTSPDAVLTARSKAAVRDVLRGANLATAGYALVHDADDAVAAAAAIGYPVVIKPSWGTDSRLAAVARNRDEVLCACRRARHELDAVPPPWREQFARGLVVEEYLRGPLVSAEIGIRGEHAYLFCLSGRTRSADDEVIEVGVHIPAELPAEVARACAEYAEAVCRAIGLDLGVFHLEMIVTPGGPVLVEANPRVMGGIMPAVYQHATGRSIYQQFTRLVCGAPVPGPARAFAGCVAGRRFFARADCLMPASWDFGWIGDYRRRLIRFDDPEALGIGSGQRVVRGQVLGRVIVHGEDYAATARTCRDIVRLAEKTLGVELMSGEYDDQAGPA